MGRRDGAKTGLFPEYAHRESRREAGGKQPAKGSEPNMVELIGRAGSEPGCLTAPDVILLQRTIGNKACQRLLSDKQKAAQATSGSEQLIIRPPGDVYEQEADRLAVLTLRESAAGSILSVPTAEDSGALRLRGEKAASDLRTGIEAARGGGQPLPGDFRARMEQSFGANLGQVRLHTDSAADGMNQAIGARAFTTGTDIFLRQGEYNSGSGEGQRILAHEITHVIQQTGRGGGANPLSLSFPAVVQAKWGEDNEWDTDIDGKQWIRIPVKNGYTYMFDLTTDEATEEEFDLQNVEKTKTEWKELGYTVPEEAAEQDAQGVAAAVSAMATPVTPPPTLEPGKKASDDAGIKFAPNPDGPQALWDFERYDKIFADNHLPGLCNALVPLWFMDLIHPPADKSGICDANFLKIIQVKEFFDAASYTYQSVPSGVFAFHVVNFFRSLESNWFESLTQSEVERLKQKFDDYSDQHDWWLVHQKIIKDSISGLYPQNAASPEQALDMGKISAVIAGLLQKVGNTGQTVSGLIEIKASDSEGATGENHFEHEMGFRITGNNIQLYNQDRGVVDGLAAIVEHIFNAYITQPYPNTDRATLIFWLITN